jgi:hypothetical protein
MTSNPLWLPKRAIPLPRLPGRATQHRSAPRQAHLPRAARLVFSRSDAAAMQSDAHVRRRRANALPRSRRRLIVVVPAAVYGPARAIGLRPSPAFLRNGLAQTSFVIDAQREGLRPVKDALKAISPRALRRLARECLAMLSTISKSRLADRLAQVADTPTVRAYVNVICRCLGHRAAVWWSLTFRAVMERLSAGSS